MVVMSDGELDKASYRRFNIAGPFADDFAAMYQVLSRRLRRGKNGDVGWAFPDLIVVDGVRANFHLRMRR